MRHLHHHLASLGPELDPDLVGLLVALVDGVGRVDQQVDEDLTQPPLAGQHGRRLAEVLDRQDEMVPQLQFFSAVANWSSTATILPFFWGANHILTSMRNRYRPKSSSPHIT